MRLSPAIWKHPLRTALLLALITRRTVLQRSTPHVSTDQRHRAIAELRRLVPPPPVFKLGERVTADTYARFLAICEWDAERAAKLLRRDFVWRAKYKPRLLKPSDMPIACSQRGWVVMMTPANGQKTEATLDEALVTCGIRSSTSSDSISSSSGGVSSGVSSSGGVSSTGSTGSTGSAASAGSTGSAASAASAIRRRWRSGKLELHPPHTRPTMQQWRYTRSGMPITYFLAKAWHPEYVPHEERIRYVACQMEDGEFVCVPDCY